MNKDIQQKYAKKNSVFIDGYNRLANNYYVIYSLLFCVFFGVVFVAFFLNHKSLVWEQDGLVQDYPNLIYTRNWIKNFFGNLFTEGKLQVRMWDMTIGEGVNVLNAVSFRPWMLLSLIFPEGSLEYFFWFRAFMSMYISGLTFLWFCKLFKNLDFSCLVGALIYVFSGITIVYCVQHMLYFEWNMYLPVMLYGVEKILRQKSGKVFAFAVAISGLSYFYSLYMLTMFAVLYAVIRFCYIKQKSSKICFLIVIRRCVFYYVIGLGVAAISFLPNVLLVFSSGRTDQSYSKGLSLFYDLDYYVALLTSIFSMKSTKAYGRFLGLSALVVILIFVLLAQKKRFDRRKMQLCLMLFIGMVMMLSPIFTFVMNGGGGVTQRWMFVSTFGAGMMAAFGLDGEWFLEKKIDKKKFWMLAGCYFLICFFIEILKKDDLGYFVFPYLYVAVYFIWESSKQSVRARRWCKGLLLSILLIEIGYKIYGYYAPSEKNMINTFLNAGTVQDECEHVAASAMKLINDEDIYRVDSVELGISDSIISRNYGQRVGVNGLSSFYSYMPGNLADTLNQLGVCKKMSGFDYSSYDQRTVLDELSAVKYVTVLSNMKSYVPYGYDLISDKNGMAVYRNRYSLPLIYAYSTVIADNEWDKLSANLKEQAMLQGAVIHSVENTNLKKEALEFDALDILTKEDILTQMAGQAGEYVLTDSSIECKNKCEFRLHLPCAVTGEVYVLIDGFGLESNSMSLAYLSAGFDRGGGEMCGREDMQQQRIINIIRANKI